MQINLEISDKRISDLLHGHSGNVSSWLCELEGKWNGKKGAFVRYEREKDEKGDGKGRKIVTRNQVEQGLMRMAKQSTGQFAQFLKGNDDDITFDTAWQYIIFGKLAYA